MEPKNREDVAEKDLAAPEKNKEVIDLRTLCRTIMRHWRRYLIVMPIIVGLSVLGILQVPRYYECKVELSPELSSTPDGGLRNLMSNVGLGGLAGAETEAIYPFLYPDLINSTEFCQSMFDVPIETHDGRVKTDYKTYLLRHQQHAPWDEWVSVMKKRFMSGQQPKAPVASTDGNSSDHIIRLSKVDHDIVTAISSNINCTVDKKTEVIFIRVTDQDPLVCAAVADTVMTRLQDFIMEYRTKKARIDLEYSEKIYEAAKKEYDEAHERHFEYTDSHRDVVSPAAEAIAQKLEGDMNLKLSTLTEVTRQLQLAKAKVQENTPAFTVVQGPAMPLLPAGPKRVLFVLGMTILAFVLTTLSLFASRLWSAVD